MTDLRSCYVRLFEIPPQDFQLIYTRGQATPNFDLFLDSVQPQAILLKRGVCSRRGFASKVILIESDGQRRIDGEDELCIALSPVSKVRLQ
jgi:hypothetical protein